MNNDMKQITYVSFEGLQDTVVWHHCSLDDNSNRPLLAYTHKTRWKTQTAKTQRSLLRVVIEIFLQQERIDWNTERSVKTNIKHTQKTSLRWHRTCFIQCFTSIALQFVNETTNNQLLWNKLNIHNRWCRCICGRCRCKAAQIHLQQPKWKRIQTQTNKTANLSCCQPERQQ